MNIPKYFRMQYVADHYRNYTEVIRRSISNRRQYFDQQSQLYSVIRNPELGEKLPSFVKFPKLSVLFEKLSRKHVWAQHRLGKHNGLYFIPTEETTEQCQNFTLPNVVIGNMEITQTFFREPLYGVLEKGLQYLYLKLDMTETPGLIQLKNIELNIMENTRELVDLCKYEMFKLTNYYNCHICNPSLLQLL